MIPGDELRPRSGSRWGSVSRAWLDARDRRDLEALAALTHEHAVWESPVDGMLRGRTHVVEQVRAGFADSDTFSSQLLSFEQRGDRAVAIVRNTGSPRRRGARLRQALHFEEQDGLVALVRIVADDPRRWRNSGRTDRDGSGRRSPGNRHRTAASPLSTGPGALSPRIENRTRGSLRRVPSFASTFRRSVS